MKALGDGTFSLNLFLGNRRHQFETMWSSNCLVYWISSMILASHTVFGTEFTFDLADSIQECFYEMVKEGVECSLDYQVSLSESKKYIHFIQSFGVIALMCLGNQISFLCFRLLRPCPR